ncbi:hypothetical protein CT19431_40402 [Cupriavidus taiwanensis]|nr:hypothetical protein CT19431_40402 [Cupriavidus taiwanensis]
MEVTALVLNGLTINRPIEQSANIVSPNAMSASAE